MPYLRSACSCLAAALTVAVTALPVRAQTASAPAASYRFVVLADSVTEVKPIWDKAPSIDEDGAVAFIAWEGVFGAAHRVLVASEPGAETFAEYTQVDAALGLAPSTEQIGSFANGRLAYLDYLAASPTESTIYRWQGGAPVPVVPVTPIADAPAMNVLGMVTILQDLPRAVIATDGEETAVVASGDTVFGDGTEIDNLILPAPDIDGVGRVAYFASIASQQLICDDRILLSGTNPPLVLASGGVLRDDCTFRTLDPTIPIAANDHGSAAYAGDFSTPGGPVTAIFVDGTVVWETRIGGFEDLGGFPIAAVALNDAGTVAFLLEFSGDLGRRLYLGPDPVEDRVIGRGDPLCDGVVKGIEFHRFGLNDAGQMALGIELVGGRHLVVRAEPTLTEPGACVTEVPEPALGGTAAGVALALLTALRTARARAARGAPACRSGPR
ncbi:MAG: hypothetical protein OZ948_06505 [Deltaproteobacteria bacterium]|nr:hypothetical protein [Deltaproteobacteria bacterium]